MKLPKVSVILPNYNHANYLCERIDSILNQSFTDFELILLDDCSTDNSRDILSSYQTSPKISHVVFNEKNSGSTFIQWDKGLKLAKGEYIWIAESDDMADPDFLKHTIEQLDHTPLANIAFTGSYKIDKQGNILKEDDDLFTKNTPLASTYSGNNFIRERMLWKNSIYNASMVLFRKECYPKITQDYRKLRYCGDWLFWIEICKMGEVICINRKLNYFRQHDNKVTPKALKEGLYFTEGCTIIIDIMDYLHLSEYQRKVVSGRTWKRLLKFGRSNKALKKQLERSLRHKLLQNRITSILFYEFDKRFNLSGLQQ